MDKILVFISVCLLAFVMVSCRSDISENTNTYNYDNGEIKSGDMEQTEYNTVNIYIGSELKYTKKYPNTSSVTVFDLIDTFCREQDIQLSHLDGYINGIDGVLNSADRGWFYYFNGNMPEASAADYTIVKGNDNVIDFKYLKFSEAFPEK
ncbi:MAG: DUF4430 domain-containing protein [Clostridia bacterium]|nr:DUF4430 domain-containing protein [Clostridia bacterium]